MKDCGFFDLGCHALNVGLGWWLALPWYFQVGIVVGIGFMAWGMIERAIFAVRKAGEFVHKIGGWPAVVGAVLVAVTVLASIFWPRSKRTGAEPEPKHGKSSPGFEFPKIGLPRMGGKKRVYDQDTNSWKDAP